MINRGAFTPRFLSRRLTSFPRPLYSDLSLAVLMLDEKSSNTASVVVLCTAPDEATAQDLAAKVLAEKLAACATLIPGATSLYYWEGKLEQEYEVQMILKTTVSHQQALLECLKSHHPYQTPELLVLPVTHGDTDYLSWLNASLR